jgi:fluoride exporter
MSRIFYVFLGGGAGSAARYLVTIAAARLLSPALPFGTLIANGIGCFLIGFVHSFAMQSARLSSDVRLFLTTGVLGGLTTYSTFNYEALEMFERGETTRAMLYAATMLVGCAGAGVLGIWVARSLFGSM